MNVSSHSGAGWRVWALLAICAAVFLGAMTWLTREVLQSQQDRSMAEARADLQERMRLALWRMDSTGATLILGENQLSAASFHQKDDFLISDAPLPAPSPPIRLRFELKENGLLHSPEDDSPARLDALRSVLNDNNESRATFQNLCQSIRSSEFAWSANVELQDIEAKVANTNAISNSRNGAEYQQAANLKEKAVRNRAVDSALKQQEVQQNTYSLNGTVPEQSPTQGVTPFEIGIFRPSWIGNELFLLRNVRWIQGSRVTRTIQGIWIDTQALRQRLLEETRDLLPDARLHPVLQATDSADTLTLASVPFRLDPGKLTLPTPSLDQPIVGSLAAGWLAALLAILTAATLIRGIVRLSERRASFVSAVTHELRTPLTTFRLYSDMLESGVVRGNKRDDYFRTLRREADRLSHLVENVLAFSRIERGSARAEMRTISWRLLLEPMRERFETRLASAQLSLVMPLDTPLAEGLVRVDAAAVEHILFNLIDNAAKYAVNSAPPQIEITLERTRDRTRIRVRDHGPGIPLAEQRKIFQPFHKSAQAAAESRPGVGLGLALSRRLAHDLGGSLKCETPKDGGTAFLLSLPSAQEA